MVLPAALKATAFLLPPIYLILWYKVSFVPTGLLLLLCSCFELYLIFKGTLLGSVLAVVLAAVLISSLELGGDDVHTYELFAAFIRIFTQVFVVCHAAAKGTCELVDDDSDHCPIWYFGIGVQSINLIEVVMDWSSLPKFGYLQVCPICAVMVSIVQFDPSLYFSPGCVFILVSFLPVKSFSFHT